MLLRATGTGVHGDPRRLDQHPYGPGSLEALVQCRRRSVLGGGVLDAVSAGVTLRCGWQLRRAGHPAKEAALALVGDSPHRPVAAVSLLHRLDSVGGAMRKWILALVAALSVVAALAATPPPGVVIAENIAGQPRRTTTSKG